MQQDKDPIDEINVELDDQPSPNTTHSKYPIRNRGGGGKKRIILIVAVVVLALGLLAGAAYWFLGRDDDTNEQTAVSEQTQEEPGNNRPQLSPAEAAEPVVFKSDTLNLEFTHRKDWTVMESEDKSTLSVTSPAISYQTVDGNVPESAGVFTLKIGIGVSDAATQTINSAVAAKDSEVIAYDEPTEQQRFYTNLAYAGQNDNFSFLIVTGSSEYKAGDPLAGTLALSGSYYLIGGGYGEDPDNAFAFDPIAPELINQSAAPEQAVAIIKSLKIY